MREKLSDTPGWLDYKAESCGGLSSPPSSRPTVLVIEIQLASVYTDGHLLPTQLHSQAALRRVRIPGARVQAKPHAVLLSLSPTHEETASSSPSSHPSSPTAELCSLLPRATVKSVHFGEATLSLTDTWTKRDRC